MKLSVTDIRTKEVLGWSGLHLFHAHESSCSQKVRMAMNVKGISYTSHMLDLIKSENLTEFYLGINPRGLVPAIVHDGDVHIESNDIVTYLDSIYPEVPLIPAAYSSRVSELLRHEDDLHLDLRTLSFRFLLAPDKPPKSQEDLERYATLGAGTVGGVRDDRIDEEIQFWSHFFDSSISDDAALKSARRFREAFDRLDAQLAGQSYILGNELSIVDIAWLVYVHRLRLSGYPLAALHPRLDAWSTELAERPAFRDEVALPLPVIEHIAKRQKVLADAGLAMVDVCADIFA